ncbi:uncharacterized protein LOC101236893 [Hydra vulgaris]|uniref:uncharacterized protein LOC101236893 n=1 Tax=Hydra vulgaris TaxID=6087 RepID=UPI0002B40F92|nr:uncharacterized protein LOC101236893 [Hydra vulgaris]XP_012555633.1 uncharacterized protein LOC101236893 [Hydra vulgaris]
MNSNFENDLTCSICLDIADNAVETKCCNHIFCENCVKFLSFCPLCWALPFSFNNSFLARRLIGNLTKKCPNEGCGKDVPRSEFSKHELLCEFSIFKCYIPTCNFKSTKNDLMNHLLTCHSNSVIKILEEYYSTNSSNQINVYEEPNNSHNFISTKINSRGRQARLGATGKYYCLGGLDPTLNCKCCNGVCGPTSGCNCTSCMALDIRTRKLPYGWYVNKEGFPCIKGEGGIFYCGRKMDLFFSDGYCGPYNGPNCLSCQIIGSEESAYQEALLNLPNSFSLGALPVFCLRK